MNELTSYRNSLPRGGIGISPRIFLGVTYPDRVQPLRNEQRAPDTKMGNVYAITDAPPWLLATFQKLQEVAQLKKGWDSYGGLPLRQDIRIFAVELLRCIEGKDLQTPAVVLGSAGNVQFEWSSGGRELEIEVVSPNAFEYLKIFPNGEMEEGEVAFEFRDQLQQLMHWLKTGE